MTPECPVIAELRRARTLRRNAPLREIRPLSPGARACVIAFWAFCGLVATAAVLDFIFNPPPFLGGPR